MSRPFFKAMMDDMRIRRIKRHRTGRPQAENSASLPARPQPQQRAVTKPRVVLVGPRLFGVRIKKTLADVASLDVIAAVESAREAVTAVSRHGAELAVVEINPINVATQAMLARTIMDRSPGCGIMLICSAFTGSIARHMWVYGADSWSVLTGASSKNPAQVTEAVNSAVRGMTWVEPGVRRVMASYGPRPKSIEERRLLMLDGSGEAEAVAA